MSTSAQKGPSIAPPNFHGAQFLVRNVRRKIVEDSALVHTSLLGRLKVQIWTRKAYPSLLPLEVGTSFKG